MPIIGTNWFKSGTVTGAASGMNTVTHGLGFTPDFFFAQYITAGSGGPSLPLVAIAASQDRTFWAFCMSTSNDNVTAQAIVARLHSVIS